ncbi:hypothetical protein BDZ97DRAFT_271062 [Flammula alnicola]|nr:hypothetical protein BDZ97DRAFT_271062 [Flammula alnicola]
MDPRDDRTSAIRAEMKKLMLTHMKPAVQVVQQRPLGQLPGTGSPPPSLPPIGVSSQNNNLPPLPQKDLQQSSDLASVLPPLSFGGPSTANAMPSRERPLTPITERSSILTHGQRTSMDGASMLNRGQSSFQSVGSPQSDQQQQHQDVIIAGPPSAGLSATSAVSPGPSPTGPSTLLNGPISHSPTPASPTYLPPSQSAPAVTAGSPLTSMSSQASTNGFNQSRTSLATSANVESSSKLAVQGRSSFDTRSPPISPLPRIPSLLQRSRSCQGRVTQTAG